MEAGADDYLTKPFNAHELAGASARPGAAFLDLQEQLLHAREALRETGHTRRAYENCSNRSAIMEVLRNEIAPRRAGNICRCRC